LVSISDPRGSAWLIGTGGRGGQIVWRYDGTHAAPKKVFELERSRKSCSPRVLGSLRGGAFVACSFVAESLWFAEPGSPATSLLQRPAFYLGALAVANDRALWSDGQQHFLTDGTLAGTVTLPSPPNAQLGGAAAFGEGFAMLGYEYTGDGLLGSLYRIDPAVPEALRVKTLDSYSFSGLHSSGGYLYFQTSQRLWRSDLTAAGTVEMAAAYSPDLSELVRFGPLVLWRHQFGLRWLRDDETIVHSLATNLSVASMAAVGSRLFLRSGSAIYRIDLDRLASQGTAEPLRLKPLSAGHPGFDLGGHGDFAPLPDGRVLFGAYTPETGYELHVSDGTVAGTRLFVDLYPGPLSGLHSDPVAVGGGVAFVGRDDDHGKELWYSEGSAASTSRATDIWAGNQSSSPDNFFATGSRLYFSADDGIKGRELWMFEAPEPR
jgi:ELWxxDGT repeat protein